MERSSVWCNDAREAQWVCTRMIKRISCHCCFILSRDTRFYFTQWINFLLFSSFYYPTFISLTVIIQLSSCTSKTVIFGLCSMAGVRPFILVPPPFVSSDGVLGVREEKRTIFDDEHHPASLFFLEDISFIGREVTDKRNENRRYQLCAHCPVTPQLVISVQKEPECLGEMI